MLQLIATLLRCLPRHMLPTNCTMQTHVADATPQLPQAPAHTSSQIIDCHQTLLLITAVRKGCCCGLVDDAKHIQTCTQQHTKHNMTDQTASWTRRLKAQHSTTQHITARPTTKYGTADETGTEKNYFSSVQYPFRQSCHPSTPTPLLARQ